MSLLPTPVSGAAGSFYFALANAPAGSQTLDLSGNTLSISGGNSVNIAAATLVSTSAVKLTAQSFVPGLNSTEFSGQVVANGNIESAPALGAGSAVLDGGNAEVTIGGSLAQPPKVRFQIPAQPDGVIEYTGATFTFNPPLTDSDFQTLSILGDQLSISGGNTVTLPAPAPQTLDLSGNELSISDGNTVTLPAAGAPGGASGDIQYNNGAGGFAGEAVFTYDSANRIVRITQDPLLPAQAGVNVSNSATGKITDIRSGDIYLVAAGQQVIQMVASDFPSIAVKFADNSIRTDVFGDMVRIEQSGAGSSILAQGSVVLSDFATGSQTRLAVAPIPVCRVANTTTSTEQNASSFDMYQSNALKASLAYNAGSGGVGITSVNNGEIFLSRSDGSTPESIFALQANNTYSLGNPATASNCVLDFNKGATEGQITFDGSGFVFNPPLPAPPATAPAGADTQLQFNNAGAFGASSNLTFAGSRLQVVGAVDISGAAPQLNMADLSGNSFVVELGIAPQPQVSFVGQAGATMDLTPEAMVITASGGVNSVDINAALASVAVSDGTETATLQAGFATASLPPTADDQLTRKDYVDAAVAGASGATPYIIYCSATAAPGGDGSFATPYNTIADAITAAVTGSLIYLSGTFAAVQTTITKSNFTLKALGQAVIQYSSGAIPTTPYRGFWGLGSGTSNVTFDGITFSSTIQPAAELNLLSVAGSNHAVRNCVFAGPASYDAFNPGTVTTRGLQIVGGVANVLVEDCDIYNLRQPVYTNNGSGAFLRNSITNTRGAVNSTAGNFFQYTANSFGQNVLDIVILTGVQTGAPYFDLYQLSADNNYAVVQDQRVTPNITLQASLPNNVSYNTAFPLGTIAQPYFTYFLNSGLGGSIAMPSTTNANGQWISFNNVPQLPNAGTLTITSSSANIYDAGTLNTAVVLTAGQQKKFLFSSAANAWLPFL
jgi:hypothetical protein